MSIDSILKSHGKNLFDINNVYSPLNTDTYEISDNKLKVYRNRSFVIGVIYHIPLPVGTQYTLYYDIEYGGTATGIYNCADSKIFNGSFNKVNYTGTVGDTGYLTLEFSRMGGENDKLGWVTYSNIQVELGSTATSYEEYWKGPNVITLPYKGNNIITYPYENTTQTINGVTFTDNGDGTITVNGTAVSDAVFWLFTPTKTVSQWGLDSTKDYFFRSLRVSGKDDSGYTMFCAGIQLRIQTVMDTGRGFTLEKPNARSSLGFKIVVLGGKTVNDVTFYPQLLEKTENNVYEDYSANTGNKDVEKVIYRSKNLWSNESSYTLTAQTNNYYTEKAFDDSATLSLFKSLSGKTVCMNYDIDIEPFKTHGSEVIIYYNEAINSAGATWFQLDKKGKTLPVGHEPKSIRLRARSNSADGVGKTPTISNIQLEIGDKSTSYVPYKQEVIWTKPTN